MEESSELPLRRVELALSKFNDVAIPHHLDLLRQHRANIAQHSRAGQWVAVRAEQARARRVVQQLRALLGELETLRARVAVADRARFDALTRRARDSTLAAVRDYLGVIESGQRTIVCGAASRPIEMAPRIPEQVAGSAVSGDSVGVLPDLEPELLQLQVDEQEAALREREAVLRGWSELAGDVRALHEAWQHMQAAALQQRAAVERVAGDVDRAADDVAVARAQLSAAERLRGGAWLAGGAALGALAGGPVGLVVGVKAGAAAALAGSLLGCVGVRLLGRRALPAVPALPGPASDAAPDHTKSD